MNDIIETAVRATRNVHAFSMNSDICRYCQKTAQEITARQLTTCDRVIHHRKVLRGNKIVEVTDG